MLKVAITVRTVLDGGSEGVTEDFPLWKCVMKQACYLQEPLCGSWRIV